MSTIKDVAKQVGVSTATVSHVINKTRFVSGEITERVLQVIRDLNYQPNAIARSLVKRKTHTIGIIISDILNPFYTAIVRGIEDVTYKSGYNVMLCNTDEDVEKEVLYIQVLLEKRIDGLVLSSAFQNGIHPLASQLKKIPLVSIVRKIKGVTSDGVFGDNAGGAYQAIEHFIQLGHRRVGIISGPLGLSSGAERLEGYKKALADHQIPIEEHWIKLGDFKKESGYSLTKKLFQEKHLFTALFVVNNQMTIGALNALTELGVRIPEDLSLISFDDMEWYSLINPSLTTIEQSPYLLGKTAGEMLLQKINHKRRNSKKVVIPSRLIIRNSTAGITAERR
ncbi:MAG: LacI family transcriptional regulator [Deltaproteobacteria bacterium]|nr:LacI family transcriptional regulator [Deltaproteobacteria bacterium]